MVGEQELLRVLVVDDEPNIVDVVSMALPPAPDQARCPRSANGARTCWCST